MDKNLNVVLVNLISENFLARYQAPLAVNVLSGYFKVKCHDTPIHVLDMQNIFETFSNNHLSIHENFKETVNQAIMKLIFFCRKTPTIIGLSIKWTTQKIAAQIIEAVNNACTEFKPLFVIGNIGSTHGFNELLVDKHFMKTVAVVGEGEEALVSIAKMAKQNISKMINVEIYQHINNVAVNINGNIHLAELKRVDLEHYPALTINNPSDIYDKEWDVHAMETSRGCPWGKCTFCSIKNQFGGKNLSSDWYWQAFSINKILKDIKNYAMLGVRNFDIKDSEFFGPTRSDDEFNQTMGRVEEFAKGIFAINEELKSIDNIPNKTISITHVSARVDTIFNSDPEESIKNLKRKNIYALLKSAGLRRVYLGIESGSRSQLRRYCKGVTVKESGVAIKILRELGLDIEVGFIFFDYLANLDELQENIEFIEQNRLHETDSRILGSLRIQKGCSYVLLAKNKGLLKDSDNEQLSYDASFVDADVAKIEHIFCLWEKATYKLMKILPSYFRTENYKMDFYFVKDILNCFTKSRTDLLSDKIKKHKTARQNFLTDIKESINDGVFGKKPHKLLSEFLEFAIKKNKKEVKL